MEGSKETLRPYTIKHYWGETQEGSEVLSMNCPSLGAAPRCSTLVFMGGRGGFALYRYSENHTMHGNEPRIVYHLTNSPPQLRIQQQPVALALETQSPGPRAYRPRVF